MDKSKKTKINSLSKKQLQLLLKKRALQEKFSKTILPKISKNEKKEFPLSSNQEAVWFLDKLYLKTVISNIPVFAIVNVEFDISKMENAFEEVIKRHDILRTSFSENEGIPVQKTHDSVQFNLDFKDLSMLNDEDKDVFFKEYILQKALVRIPLDKAPMLTFEIVKLSKQKHLFLYNPHHIISDGWSNQNILKELFEIYNSILKVGHHSLKEIQYQYVDFVNWEKAWLNSENYSKQINYWKNNLNPIPETLNLPIDKKRPSIISTKGKKFSEKLSFDLTNYINGFCINNDVTSFNLFFSALSILLFRLTEQNTVPIGIRIANRSKYEFQNVQGLFVNTLPFITNINGTDNLFDVLEKVKIQSKNNFKNQQLPFDKILSELKVERDLSIFPLFQVLFVFQNIPSLYNFKNIKIEPCEIDVGLTKNDINIWIEEFNGRFSISLMGNTDIFSLNKLKRILKYYSNLIRETIYNPKLEISDINFLPEDEQIGLIGKNKYNKSTDNFLSIFSKNINNDNVAVEFRDKKLTYRELETKSNELSIYIFGENKINKPIVFFQENEIESVVIMLAIIKTGVPFVPIDKNYSSSVIQNIIKDCGAELIISSCNNKNLLKDTDINLITYSFENEIIPSKADNIPDKIINNDNIVYIYYNSGVTKQQKGVVITHSALINSLYSLAQRIDFKPESRFSTIFSDVSKRNTTSFLSLMLGGKISIISDEEIHSKDKFEKLLKEKPIDYLNISPSYLSTLLIEKNIIPPKAIIFEGEKLPSKLLKIVRDLVPNIEMFNCYSTAESTGVASVYKVDTKDINEDISIGKPIQNSYLLVLDKYLNLMPVGVEGELYIGGASLAKGYFNNLKLTDENFSKDPYNDDSILFKTGDRAIYKEDGNFYLRDRKDRKIKISGNTIDLETIEAIIEELDIIDRAVLLRPSSQTFNQLWAIVTPNKHIIGSELKKILKSSLPDYAIPDLIYTTSKIPITKNGKIDFKKILEFCKKQINENQKLEDINLLLEKEKSIAKIFSKVLKINSIQKEKSFFSLGGNSPKSVELLCKINKTFNLNLPLTFIFEELNVENMAKKINNIESFSKIIQIQKGNGKQNLFLVHPGGGNLFCYKEFVDFLKKDIGIVGVQSNLQETRYKNIEMLASNYIAEIEKHIGDGEIILGGWSIGGIIAYEMAVQLEKKFNIRPKVIIIDQIAVQNKSSNRKTDEIDSIVKFAEYAENLIGKKLNIDGAMVKGLSDIDKSLLFMNVFKEYDLVPENIRIDEFDEFIKLMIHHIEISESYIPPKYTGEIIIIKSESPLFIESENQNENYFRSKDLLWKPFAKNIKLISSSGNHISMMHSPFIKQMLKRLNEIL